MKSAGLLCISLFFLAACSSSNGEDAGRNAKHDSAAISNINPIAPEDTLDRADTLKRIWGYRFRVEGDFDGDGKKEEMREHYYSTRDKQEVNKFFADSDGNGMFVDSAVARDPWSYAICSNPAIDTLTFTHDIQQFGLSYLKNEGDLDADGRDDLSYVINWADWSNLNTWHIVGWKKGKWQQLYSFGIWDWQLPELPDVVTQFGPFGTTNKVVIAGNDSINRLLEDDLKAFPGMVKKVGRFKIRVIYRNDEAFEDTIVVDLRGRKSK